MEAAEPALQIGSPPKRVADEMQGEAIADLFKDGRWDGKKMVRSFARMGTLKDEDIRKETSEEVSLNVQACVHVSAASSDQAIVPFTLGLNGGLPTGREDRDPVATPFDRR